MISIIDVDDIVDCLQELIAIQSVNPKQEKGGKGEEAITRHLRRRLRQLDFGPVFDEQVGPGRYNIYARINAGDTPSDTIDVFDAHVDTVAAGDWPEAFQGEVRDGRVYGRGAVDVKCNWAIWLSLLAAMKANGLRPSHDILLVGTVDEEVDLLGAMAFLEWIRKSGLKVRRLVVAEPTGLRPAIGHRGVYRAEVQVPGREAHTAFPELGNNPIVRGARCILALDALDRRYRSAAVSSPLGRSIVTMPKGSGGVSTNMLPDRFKIVISARVGGDRSVEQLRHDIAQAVAAGAAEDAEPGLEVTIEEQAAYPPVLGDMEGELVKWMKREFGVDPTVLSFGTNLFVYGNEVTPNLMVFGPGDISVAHTDQEHVSISDLKSAAEMTAKLWGVPA